MKRKYKVIVENRSYTVTDRRGLSRRQLREAVAQNLGVDSDEVEIADDFGGESVPDKAYLDKFAEEIVSDYVAETDDLEFEYYHGLNVDEFTIAAVFDFLQMEPQSDEMWFRNKFPDYHGKQYYYQSDKDEMREILERHFPYLYEKLKEEIEYQFDKKIEEWADDNFEWDYDRETGHYDRSDRRKDYWDDYPEYE